MVEKSDGVLRTSLRNLFVSYIYDSLLTYLTYLLCSYSIQQVHVSPLAEAPRVGITAASVKVIMDGGGGGGGGGGLAGENAALKSENAALRASLESVKAEIGALNLLYFLLYALDSSLTCCCCCMSYSKSKQRALISMALFVRASWRQLRLINCSAMRPHREGGVSSFISRIFLLLHSSTSIPYASTPRVVHSLSLSLSLFPPPLTQTHTRFALRSPSLLLVLKH